MFKNITHLPTWRSFLFNLVLIFLVPFSLYLLFDATGLTFFIIDRTRDVGHSFFHPTLFGEDRGYSMIDHVKIFLYLVFHSGAAHIAACASSHFIIQAVKDLHCLLFHKHHRDTKTDQETIA